MLASATETFFNARSERFGCCLIALGDSFLTPVRYLFNGKVLSYGRDSQYSKHICCFQDYPTDRQKTLYGLFLKCLAYLLLIPGVVIGSSLKLCGHLNICVALPMQIDYTRAMHAFRQGAETFSIPTDEQGFGYFFKKQALDVIA